ncbi:hypothetical protein DW66_4366 [Pseudomonas putida]|nr:hypothetical protein DW66_4366 [Pseudomonas putida]
MGVVCKDTAHGRGPWHEKKQGKTSRVSPHRWPVKPVRTHADSLRSTAHPALETLR